MDFDTDDRIQKSFVKIFVVEIFMQKNQMKRQAIEDKLTDQVYNWLQPHHIRTKAYEKFIQVAGR